MRIDEDRPWPSAAGCAGRVIAGLVCCLVALLLMWACMAVADQIAGLL